MRRLGAAVKQAQRVSEAPACVAEPLRLFAATLDAAIIKSGVRGAARYFVYCSCGGAKRWGGS